MFCSIQLIFSALKKGAGFPAETITPIYQNTQYHSIEDPNMNLQSTKTSHLVNSLSILHEVSQGEKKREIEPNTEVENIHGK